MRIVQDISDPRAYKDPDNGQDLWTHAWVSSLLTTLWKTLKNIEGNQKKNILVGLVTWSAGIARFELRVWWMQT